MLIGDVPPILLKSPSNPSGTPLELFDGLRASLLKDRSQFYKLFALIFYPGLPHGLTATHADRVNAELLAFIRA